VSSGLNEQPSIIVGGGISGLAAAYYLAKKGKPSLLFEPGRVGGVLQTKTVGGCLLEEGPDSFLSAKPEAMELIRELGLEQDVIGSNDHQRATWIWRDGKMIPLPDGLMMMVPTKVMPMVKSPLLSWGTKMRMGLELLRQPKGPQPDRSVGEFIEDHYGPEAVEYLAEPLLSGVYGGDPYKLSIQSVMPRFAEMEARYGSLTKGTLAGIAKAPKGQGGGTLFRTLKGGLGTLVEALQKAITPHCRISSAKVRAIRRGTEGGNEAGYSVETTEGMFAARHVVVATPAWAAGEILRELDSELASLLLGVGYSSSLTAGLIYDRAAVRQHFAAFGFLVPRKERRALVACTFVDQKFDYRVPKDRLLLRCFLGGAGNESALAWDDQQVQQAIQDDLRAMLGLEAKPIAISVSRWPKSMAQYETGHAGKLSKIEDRLSQYPLLFLAGNGYRGIGISDCIKSGRAAVPIS
jgi:oxygen-dependent protoporphyrinogen oxidase